MDKASEVFFGISNLIKGERALELWYYIVFLKLLGHNLRNEQKPLKLKDK